MDTLVLTAVLINFAVLGLFVATMVAHCLNSWTHSMRGFAGMLALTFLVTEFWMASATQFGSLIMVPMSILLTAVLVATIKFGFDALVLPSYKRIISHIKVKPISLHRMEPHLSSK